MAAEVDAVEAEAAGHREVLRSEVDEERATLVRARAVALGQLEQAVGDDDPGDLPLVERARRRAREQVDVRQRVELEAVAADPAEELVVLACVPADLVDHEARARPRLLAQLEVLRHHLALVALVVRDDAAEEEVRPLKPRARYALVRKAGVHLGEEVDEPDRVDVEDGCREALVTHDRVVAREREHVVEARRAELPAAALERVSVPVLAGEVDDHLLAARDHVGAERVGREHRVPARVVGDRQHVDPRVVGELPRELQHPAAPFAVIGPRLVTISVATTKEPGRASRSFSVAMLGLLRPSSVSVRRTPSASHRRTSCAPPRRTGTG